MNAVRHGADPALPAVDRRDRERPTESRLPSREATAAVDGDPGAVLTDLGAVFPGRYPQGKGPPARVRAHARPCYLPTAARSSASTRASRTGSGTHMGSALSSRQDEVAPPAVARGATSGAVDAGR